MQGKLNTRNKKAIYSDMFFKHNTINTVGSSGTIFYRLTFYLWEKRRKTMKRKRKCYHIWLQFIQGICSIFTWWHTFNNIIFLNVEEKISELYQSHSVLDTTRFSFYFNQLFLLTHNKISISNVFFLWFYHITQ